MSSRTTENERKTSVFDVANWLHRAGASRREPAVDDYVPKHRAEGPAV